MIKLQKLRESVSQLSLNALITFQSLPLSSVEQEQNHLFLIDKSNQTKLKLTHSSFSLSSSYHLLESFCMRHLIMDVTRRKKGI